MAVYDIRGKKIASGAVDTAFNNIVYPDYTVIPVSGYPNHGSTWVGNTIWAFDKPSEGGLKVYDSSFNLIKSVNTQFYFQRKDGTTQELEMKSVDFNNNNSVLIVGSGATTYSAADSYIFAFYNVEEWLSAVGQITFSNCGDYTKLDVSELGIKPYGFWAGNSPDCDQIFVVCNRFEDIYLIELGKGPNILEKGTFTQPNISSQYNGTFKVLNHWKIQTSETENTGSHDGQYYKGALYLVNSDSTKNEIYRCNLKNDGTLIFDILNAEHYMPNGTMRYRYIDGFCIKDGFGYGSPLYVNGAYNTGTNKVVLKIAIP